VRAKAEESLRVVKERLVQAQEALIVKTKAAAKVTDAYVHENPWKAIGVAAGCRLADRLVQRPSLVVCHVRENTRRKQGAA
jgi:ElaB/YqjD/DUF883 family membrane-anchored ribosome-binding protein